MKNSLDDWFGKPSKNVHLDVEDAVITVLDGSGDSRTASETERIEAIAAYDGSATWDADGGGYNAWATVEVEERKNA